MARTVSVQHFDLALEIFDVGGVLNDAVDDRVEGLGRSVPRVLVLVLAQNVLLLEHLAGIAELLHNGGDHRVLDFAEKLVKAVVVVKAVARALRMRPNGQRRRDGVA